MLKIKNLLTKKENAILPNPIKWLIQITYWIFHFGILLLLYRVSNEKNWSESLIWILNTGIFVLTIFYSFFYFIVPKYLGKSNFKFILIAFLTIIFYPPLKFFLDNQLGIESLSSVQFGLTDDTANYKLYYNLQELSRRLLTVLWNVPFALFARFMIDWFKNIRVKSKMENQQLQSELSMLRNQVNPHFLFNVLNNIDSMVYPHSEEASEAIMKLSAIMRYMLYESNVDYVPVKKEIDYLKAYIELQRMRLKESDDISFVLEDSIVQMRIAPMILIPFIENAFKHAARLQNQLKINITLGFEADQLQLKVVNSHESSIEENKDHVGGIGLTNVKKRLQLIYPHKHILNINEGEKTYTVDLTIKI